MVMTMVKLAKGGANPNRRMPRTQLRQRIADAALTLFRQQGFDAVSVDQIVARAGVSKGAFFNFFPTKSEVLLVYFQKIDSRLADLRARLDPARPQPALEKFFAKAETILRSEGPLIETLARAIWTNPALREADRISAVRDRRGFAEFFAEARKKNAIGPKVDPAIAADAVGDVWTGSLLLWLALGRSYGLATTVRPKLISCLGGSAEREKYE